MSNAKKPHQEQIDALCNELGITDPQYTGKTTIAELEKIIDKLESQLPDESDGDAIEIHAVSNDDIPDDAVVDEGSASDVEIDTDTSGHLKVKALKTFVTRVGGEDVMQHPNDISFLSESDAMHAVELGVACLIGTRK